jgi:hypothetical protein
MHQTVIFYYLLNSLVMLERYTYHEIISLFCDLYSKDYGELKFKKVADNVFTSKKLSELICLSELHLTPITARQILYTINSMGFFLFRSNRTQALGALLTLHRWHEEVNKDLQLLNGQSLQIVAIEIIRELKANFVESVLSLPRNHEVAPRRSNFIDDYLRDSTFFLDERITIEQFKQRLGNHPYQESDIPLSYIISTYHMLRLPDTLNGLENNVRLVSYFNKDNNLIKQQNVQFSSALSGLTLFLIITKSSGWQQEHLSTNRNHGLGKSSDGKFELELSKDTGYDGDDESMWLYLTYK